MGGRVIFVCWTRFQRRAASIADILDLELHYVPPPVESTWLKPFGYLAQAYRTARIVSARPDAVLVQSPPTFLPHLLLLLRRFAGRFRIVVDCHNRALGDWARFPGTIRAMNACDLVLIHNTEIAAVAESLGVDRRKLIVLEDPPPTATAGAAAGTAPSPYVLVPCSFNADEPIPTLLQAARRLPEVAFRLTGSRRKAAALGFTAAAPANVTFTDYLPVEAFDRLLAEATVVLGLTTREGIQLSVANEALGVHKPLVLSDTRILREMFGEAALFAGNDPEDLAATLREALARRGALAAASAALKVRRQARWRAQAAPLLALLGRRPADSAVARP